MIKMVRTWLTHLGLILFGVLLLVAVEGLLRLVWTPLENQEKTIYLAAIDPFIEDGDEYVTKTSFRSVMRRERIPQTKDPKTIRIFCYGGSSTFGYPYPIEKSWPKLLESRLRKLYPEKHFEVVNFGGNSYASSRILALIRGTIQYTPDLLIVSLGHNEFVEDSFRAMVKGSDAGYSGVFRSLYLTKVLTKILPTARKAANTVEVSSSGQVAEFLFSPSVQGTVYLADDERRKVVTKQFKKNLMSMIETVGDTGIPLVMATVPSNVLTWPPDPDKRVPDSIEVRDEWNNHLRKFDRARDSKDAQAVVESGSNLVNIWQGNASVDFILGRALADSGRVDEARKWLLAARDLDPSPVRASRLILDVIRDVSENNGLTLVDFETIYSRASGFGLIGEDLILDHVHPTPSGHLLSARSVTKGLISSGHLKEPELLIEEIRKMEEEEELSLSDKIEVNSDISYTYGKIFYAQGRLKKAEEMFLQAGSMHSFARLSLGSVVALQGRNHEALEILHELSVTEAEMVEIYPLMAIIANSLGKKDVVLKACKKGYSMGSKDYRLLDIGSSLLLDNREYEDAERWIKTALEYFPGDCAFASKYGRVFELQGEVHSAREQYEGILKSDQACHSAWENLGLLQMNDGELQAAATTFERAIASPGNVFPNHYLNLGHIYWYRMGLREKGLGVYSQYISLWPDSWGNIPDDVLNNMGKQDAK